MRTKSSNKSVRKRQKGVAASGSRLGRCGEPTANRGRRNDASKSTKPNPRKIQPCACGGTTFAPIGGDGMEYVALKCRRCGEDRVLRVRGRKLTVLRKLD
jgi:hypothetical protein